MMFNVKVYTNVDENAVDLAFRESDDFLAWGQEAKYKLLNQREMERQLDAFGCCLVMPGHVKLFSFVEESMVKEMPTDCRIDLVMHPTYVATAVAIYAYNRFPKLFVSGRYKEILEVLCKASSCRNLRDHGYEAEEGLVDNLLLFAQAGAAQFITNPPSECMEFAKLLKKEFKLVLAAHKSSQAKGTPVCVRGFTTVDVTDKIYEIAGFLNCHRKDKSNE